MTTLSPALGAGFFARPAQMPERHRRILAVTGILLTVLLPLWFYLLLTADDSFDLGSTLLIVPLALVIHLGGVFALSRSDDDLRRVMLVGTLGKFAAVSIYLYTAFQVYGRAVDSLHYFYQGQLYAQHVGWNQSWQLLQPFWSTNLIYMLCGAMQVFLGPSLPGISLVFALISFWGQYLCYRAFRLVAPEGDSYTMMLVIFLLPSLLYWPSSIGKDAVILLPIGMFAYGLAKLIRDVALPGTILTSLGLGGILLVRPHVAAMFALALAVPWMLSKNRRGAAGVLTRLLAAPVLLAGTLYLFNSTQEFLQMDSISQSAGVFRRVGKDNDSGGSRFNGSASLQARVVAAPMLFFRPFPWEVGSINAGIAGAEGLGLMALVWLRRRKIYAVVRQSRENPFVLFVLVFSLEFSIIFSAAITNFGLLARERVMAIPFVLMLCCFAEPEVGRDFPAAGPELAWVHAGGA